VCCFTLACLRLRHDRMKVAVHDPRNNAAPETEVA
jgi:hypothetical protein